MGTEENKTGETKKQDFSFKGCEEMMKMMSRCMGEKENKVNFEKFCGKMSDCCKEMMKKGAES